MTTLKALRGLAGHNGAHSIKTIVSNRRMKNKLRNSILRGTVIGAAFASMVGCMYTEVDPFIGCVVAGAALGYMGLFYGVNRSDALYGGA